MTNEQYEELRERFRRVFAAKWDRSELEDYDNLREKFAFHMADVARNLSALAEAYGSAAKCDIQCLSERTELFFYDCMPHLTAAAQIYDEIPKLFEEQKGVHDWSSFVDDEAAG